ncbi:flagellar motor switch protein FliN [Cupriavidus agavae]|uniref:Flagellar motor switch protein FliN n=1 Tax=Cupriavidus agavae TaxID=1001822 RepID=A0A4Q7RCC3_9BURK|nr:flagellar motor switch protein FliN [Cupriavidus agavae]RZT30793.1 flagellar motor switch protein FliN/FliY [Cupriavidus agavae]
MTDGTQDKPVDPMDDWASALAEQTSSEQAAPAAAPAAATAAPMATAPTPAAQPMATATPAASTVFPPLAQEATAGFHNDIGMILDIPVQLTVELGRTKVPIKNLLQLAQGSVVELDGLAGEPMDVLVNGYLIAQGEVVVVNDKFGIRLTDIITPSERIRKLNK